MMMFIVRKDVMTRCHDVCRTFIQPNIFPNVWITACGVDDQITGCLPQEAYNYWIPKDSLMPPPDVFESMNLYQIHDFYDLNSLLRDVPHYNFTFYDH